MMQPPQGRHPVWDVYNELRTARMNVIYYSIRASRYQRYSAWLDILTGLAGSTAIAGLAQPGKWLALAGSIVTVVAPVLRSTMKLPERVRAFEECSKGYEVLQFDLEELRQDIARGAAFTPEHAKRYDEARARRRAIIEQEPDRRPDERLARACQAQVNAEYPPEGFYVPA